MSVYKGVSLDSTWELALVQRLDELNVKWIRADNLEHAVEYTTLTQKSRRYYPDFFLPDYDVYVEVKGYWTDETRSKLDQAKKVIDLIVLDSYEAVCNFQPMIRATPDGGKQPPKLP